MSVEAVQIHATRLEVNAHALDCAHAAWLASPDPWNSPLWLEYKAIRHAYCVTLQTEFESYQRAAWDAWYSLRRFRDPGRVARKAYLRRMVEEATGRLEKLNENGDASPASEVVEAWYTLERAKFDLEVASFSTRSRHLIPVAKPGLTWDKFAARAKSNKRVQEWFEAQRVAPLEFE